YEVYRSSTPLPAGRPDLNCTEPYNCEVNASPSDPHRPPTSFAWQPSVRIAPETAAGGCPITDQPDQGVYYYDPSSGAKLGSTSPAQYMSPNPTMFTISQAYSGIRGFTVNAFTFGGAEASPPDAHALAVAYVTSNRCSAGNVEYGYYKDLTIPGQPV